MTALNLFTSLLKLGLTIVTGMDGKTYTEESVSNNVHDLMMSLFLFSRENEESLTKQKRAFETTLKLIGRHKSGNLRTQAQLLSGLMQQGQILRR
ncbi:hypothetical protein [Kosakonia oryziphila]|uniref:Uncharacterized protein n=1 Tax=Kosakonia oryziphila TaxID=1005667 RepID=A0A1C3YZR2_9ENTR|nr:hypothetical protein [Kosakonia oryziphila]SCB75559.1 hypothetical protein GA0061070_1001101 [Kosakonia oryziphila]